VSTPLSPKDARFIALRQGLLIGTITGCLALLSTACRSFAPISFNFFYLLASIVFFVAGWRAAKKTSRVDIGALAGFWAGVVMAIFAIVVLLIDFFGEYSYRTAGLSSLVGYGSAVAVVAMMALLLGPALGVLGGLIGKIYADSPTPPATSTSSSSPSPQTPPPQTSLPSSPQQNQP